VLTIPTVYRGGMMDFHRFFPLVLRSVWWRLPMDADAILSQRKIRNPCPMDWDLKPPPAAGTQVITGDFY
jgi:hypothetical protein